MRRQRKYTVAKVWDGKRARSPRTLLAQHTTTVGELQMRFVTERVTQPTDWCYHEPHHVIVVHRRGRLRSIELEFERGPSGPALPAVGDVWVIPAEHRYAALGHGEQIEFCEITVPPSALGGREVRPRINHRDPLLHQLVERMGSVIGREDVLARMLEESLAETLRLHLSDGYTGRVRRAPRRALDPAMQASLVEYLEHSLDAEISVAALAAQAEMPVADFVKAFAAAFHTTPHQFLLDRRMARAKTLLATTDRSITEIGAAVGFGTPSHFATTFKRRVGVTPSAYRAGG
ncbi:AraC family transcriptional regulator [Mycobacterium sp. pUA109]|uniref:helix-turn-helix transcriptional regulator n=1 Tax=Mycobacterium sp. pUA109 TaxID=3238982 RepID=UPI00351B5A6D